MGGISYRQFFVRPEDPVQRRYESLRAVFVDGRAMADVAEQFGVAYGTVRNWAHEFRPLCDRAAPPPFFSRLHEVVPSPEQPANRVPKNQPWPTRKRYRWKSVAA